MGTWVLAGDTIVVLEEAVLGKPEDEDHARRMLEQLQDRRHEVITGICLLNREASGVLPGGGSNAGLDEKDRTGRNGRLHPDRRAF